MGVGFTTVEADRQLPLENWYPDLYFTNQPISFELVFADIKCQFFNPLSRCIRKVRESRYLDMFTLEELEAYQHRTFLGFRVGKRERFVTEIARRKESWEEVVAVEERRSLYDTWSQQDE